MYLHLFLEVKGGLMLDFIISQCEVILQLHSIKGKACSLCLSATSQQYFFLTTNQPPATSQQYFSLGTNQHQPSTTSQTNRLKMVFFLNLFLNSMQGV
jgi:hypothetical protein